MNPAAAEAVVLTAGGARLRFGLVACGDRYHEAVTIHRTVASETSESSSPIELLRSSQRASNPLWPASPPWQHVEWSDAGGVTRGNSPIALVVGMSGSSHWSASIAATKIESGNPDREAIVLDIACRYKERPQWLGSTYELAPTTRLTSGDDHIDVLHDSGGCRVRSLATTSGHAPRLAVDAQRLTISPTITDAETPQTLRWCFALELLT